MRKILNRSTPSDGFRQLWDAGRLDLAVETAALRFASVFTPAELATARQRLREAGAPVPV